MLGGKFAIDGGALGVESGKVAYWAPDSLAWEGLGVGHSEFVQWALIGGRLAEFYANLRWDGWVEEVRAVGLDEAIAVYPPLWTTEARPIEETSRRIVLRTELEELNDELSRQMGPPRS